MSWILTLLFVAGAVLLGRIYYGIRKMKEKTVKDWDTRLIERLAGRRDRSVSASRGRFLHGHAVGGRRAHRRGALLEAEGYRADVKPAPDNPGDHPFSLHFTKSMRLSAPGMKELTARFQALAKEQGGHYDGWSAQVVPIVSKPSI